MALINDPSQLSEIITFYSKQTQKDDMGQPIEKLVEIRSCWAAIQQQFIRDIETDSNLNGNSEQINFIIRHVQDFVIQNDMVVSWRQHDYQITIINQDYSNKMWDTFSVIARNPQKQ